MTADTLADAILQRDLENLTKRVEEGGRLTKAERELLERAAGRTDDDEPTKRPKAAAGWAKNYAELAVVLGVSRRSLVSWRKCADAPIARSDGSLDIAAWQEWVRRREEGQKTTPDNDELKARKLLAEVEDRELRVAIKRGDFVPIELVANEWTNKVGRAVALLRNKFESELPPVLSGLDAAGIQAECRKAIDEVLTLLHSEDAS